MTQFTRRTIVNAIVLTAGMAGRGSRQAFASGYDVTPEQGPPILPRKPGGPPIFSHSLDSGPPKAASGGWAREVTAKQLPIATGIAGAHLYMAAGGSREMHWHATAAEWAMVLAGRCQVTVLDPAGGVEVANLDAGDMWYFPKGHSHSIQTLGEAPCHAVLAFDDGFYGEHGTFGMSDWLSQLDPDWLAQNFRAPASSFATFPKGETYIMQGEVIPLDSEAARRTREFPPAESHRYRASIRPAQVDGSAGSIRLASAKEFPMSKSMTGMVTRLAPGAMRELHWHPNANEWHYVARGQARMALFAQDKHLAMVDLATGDCAYAPIGCGHAIRNVGSEPCEIVSVLDNGAYEESSLTEWVAKAPTHLLANNLATPEPALAWLPKAKVAIAM